MTMDTKHKDLLRTNRSKLVDNIQDVKSVVDKLYEKKTITQTMQEDVLERPQTKTDQKRALLDMLPRRGPRAFDDFVDTLIDCGEWEVAEILKPGQGRAAEEAHKSSVPPSTINSSRTIYSRTHSQPMQPTSPEEEPLPDIWPDRGYEPLAVKVKPVDSANVSVMNKFEQCGNPHSQIYSMRNMKRGKVLIINNVDFSVARVSKGLKLDDRKGSNMDATTLSMLFEDDMYFYVDILENKTAQGIRGALVNMSKEDHSTRECFICFFLSHGRGGEIFGTDGDTVKIQELTDLFNSQNCQSLTGKPKLFFVQACQGTKPDTGSQGAVAGSQSSQPEQQESEPDQEISLKKKEEDEQEEVLKKLKEVNLSDQDATDAVSEANIPTRADIFVAFATTPDYLSYRNTVNGTWFVQAITYVFQKYACVNDLNTLMTKVNYLVSRGEIEQTGHKQISKWENSFIKQFYFFPGLADSSCSTRSSYNQIQPSSS